MKHTIYAKLLISYLIYGVIAFFIICTFTQHLTTDYIEKQEASNLYREASIIAGDYAAEYFGSSMSRQKAQPQGSAGNRRPRGKAVYRTDHCCGESSVNGLIY